MTILERILQVIKATPWLSRIEITHRVNEDKSFPSVSFTSVSTNLSRYLKESDDLVVKEVQSYPGRKYGITHHRYVWRWNL